MTAGTTAAARPQGQPAPAPQGDDREGRVRPAHHRPARRRCCASTASSSRSSCRRSAPVDTKQLCYSVLTDAQKRAVRGGQRARPLVRRARASSRFRANIFMQRGAVAGAFRTIPFKILTLRGARPAAGRRRARQQAARPRARHRPDRLGQVDDARVDHRQDQHRAARCTSSRSRTRSSTCTRTRAASSTSARSAPTPRAFKNALKYVLRQDPDVVLIGEMRDLETIEAALTIAETGHLVFAHAAHQHARSRPSTASSTCSRRTSRRRSARSSRSCSRASSAQHAPPAAPARRAACSRSR